MKLTTTTIIALFAIGALAAPAPIPDEWNGAGSINEWKEDLKNKISGENTGVDWQKKEDEKKKQDDWQKQEDEKKKQDDWQKEDEKKKEENNKQPDWQKKEDEKKQQDDWQKKEDEKKKQDDWQKKEDDKKQDDWQKKEDEKKKQHPDYKQPEYKKPEYKEPEHKEPEHKEPEYKKPEYKEPEHKEPEYKKPEYKKPEYKEPEHKEPEYKEPDHKDKGKTYFIPVVYDDKKPQQGPDYGKSDDGYTFTYTKSFEVKATPDQVINNDQVPTPGQPGAYGIFDFYLNPHIDQICYNITLLGVSGDYQSPARTATHIHEAVRGRAGPPRIAFPNPVGDDHRRNSYGCLTGPFTTGINAPGTTTDTGTGFKVQKNR